ncbi:hypothetical protein B4N89_40800 [Embleya scabrispora]|uniref:DUF1877 domain-containing protein n=1 Tax=Embleya scabrispora TaxID=159449 RepID=A0A1T3NJL7_9ACTN|nr:hypothetical protein B4N89_40800 [Embleya scabrispora]
MRKTVPVALTQQFARVTPAYIEACRRRATASSTGDPGWDPPADDCLDLNWDARPLPALFRRAGLESASVIAIDRALDGDPGGDIAFLDHDGVYDGMTEPPALLTPGAVAEIAAVLDAIDADRVLAAIPPTAEEIATVFRFRVEDIVAPMTGVGLVPCVAGALDRLRAFYAEAARRDLAMVVWID